MSRNSRGEKRSSIQTDYFLRPIHSLGCSNVPFPELEKMKRPQYYHNQIATKLLSSKFVYSQLPGLQVVKKLTIKSSVPHKNPEVGSVALNLLFGRRPAFWRTFRRQEKEYRLIHLLLTSNKNSIPFDLDCLATAILPFQLENRLTWIKTTKPEETFWTVENCTPATPLNPILFPYPLPEDQFNLHVLFVHKKNSPSIITFYLNLFQLPLAIAS
jgi:hypothetical protein